MYEDVINKLSSYIQALHPIIYLQNSDFHTIDNIIEEVGKQLKIIKDSEKTNECKSIKEYNSIDGYVNSPAINIDLGDFLKENLKKLEKMEKQKCTENDHLLIIIRDIKPEMYTAKVISCLKKIALNNLFNENFYSTILIISSTHEIPEDIENFVTILDIPYPNKEQIERMIFQFKEKYKFPIKESIIKDLSQYFLGLSTPEIQKTLNLCYQERGYIGQESKKIILDEKNQIIKKSGILDLVNTSDSLNNIGGLIRLTKWLKNKSIIIKNFHSAKEFNVDIPKGILIVGEPGCGKSLIAKAASNLFGIPLLRLDIGKILGKYLGESEERFHKAIKIAESVSPCILWIDEVEKAFSGVGKGNGGNEVNTRLFGTFLTWLQEKNKLVFVIATSNDISSLPPEFLRKGRFDDVFYVGLPDIDEQVDIFKIHLKKRGKKFTEEFKLFFENEYQKLVSNKYYSGADIEDIVKRSIENVFISSNLKDIGTEVLKNIIFKSKGINPERKKKIDEHRKKLEDDFGVINANGKATL